MIGIRQLLIILLLIAGFWLFKRLQRRMSSVRRGASRRAVTPTAEMVRCDRCGAYIPRDRTIEDPWQGKVCDDSGCPGRRADKQQV